MNPAPPFRRTSRGSLLFVISAVCLFAVALSGCDQFNARRKIQEAGRLYGKGKFEDAAKVYEEALKIEPNLVIGHHNAGLAYRQIFQREQADPDAKQEVVAKIADKAAAHFLIYLKKFPEDGKIIGIMTKLWLDSGQFEKALAFWEGRLAKDPKNTEVLGILAGINRQAGHWDKAVSYYDKQADAEVKPEAKEKALSNIAKLAWHKLANRQKVLGMERLHIADIGLQAMEKAGKLDLGLDSRMDVESYSSSILHFRAMAHRASWAQVADEAAAQAHVRQLTELREKQKAELAKQKAELEKQKANAGSDKGGDDGAGGDSAAPAKDG